MNFQQLLYLKQEQIKELFPKNKYYIKNKMVNLHYPKRKNQKSKNTKKTKRLLKKRHVIERCIALIKKNDKISKFKEKKMETYNGYFYMYLLYSFINRNKMNLQLEIK